MIAVWMQCVAKGVFRGLVTMVRALVAGLEHTYQSRGCGGMASTMMILEIMHTHYWEKDGSSKSDTSNQSLVSASSCFVLLRATAVPACTAQSVY